MGDHLNTMEEAHNNVFFFFFKKRGASTLVMVHFCLKFSVKEMQNFIGKCNIFLISESVAGAWLYKKVLKPLPTLDNKWINNNELQTQMKGQLQGIRGSIHWGSLSVTIPDCKTGSVTKIVCKSKGKREGREGRVNQIMLAEQSVSINLTGTEIWHMEITPPTWCGTDKPFYCAEQPLANCVTADTRLNLWKYSNNSPLMGQKQN